LADTLTPVSIYLRLRDQFAGSILMESSDYHSSENSFSFICALPISEFEIKDGSLSITKPNREKSIYAIDSRQTLIEKISSLLDEYRIDNSDNNFPVFGYYGFTAYDSATYFEKIILNGSTHVTSLPEMSYRAYQFVIAIDHFRNEILVQENLPEIEKSRMEEILSIIGNRNFSRYPFSSDGEETVEKDDNEFLGMILKGKHHCQVGDVFQIVLSRKFSRKFKGDDFNVYRALRSINPSPYLFYFDMENYRIFGSSPEAQLVIKNRKASIFPIAGTFKRKGNDEADRLQAEKLKQDVKENAEHVMLVDLARNDLGKHGDSIKVETFKEIQFYSHVIHLVSKVTAHLPAATEPLQVIADTFPAGTLSGAPKYRAMELINKIENSSRGFYGGAIGFLGINRDFNHAIMIRSFFSEGNRLHYQAGAGIVAKSDPQKELEEVNIKLGALRKAIVEAEKINV